MMLTKQRSCAHCDLVFFIDAQRLGTRENRLYCSERCRMAVYRAKKRRARALHAQGWGANWIASLVDSKTKTVLGWVNRGK